MSLKKIIFDKRKKFGNWKDWVPFYGAIRLGDRHYGLNGERKREEISLDEIRDIKQKAIYHYLIDTFLGGAIIFGAEYGLVFLFDAIKD